MGILSAFGWEVGTIGGADLVRFGLAAVSGVLVLSAARWVYGRLPAGWLCDFDESPWEMHLPGLRGQGQMGMKVVLWVLMSVRFLGGMLDSGVIEILKTVICICAIVISLCDADYMIVPDQFVAVIGGCAVALALVENAGGEMLYGALWGGGIMVLTSAIGLISGKGGAIGFGDVKLMAVCGAVAGERVFVLYVLMAVSSGVYFTLMVAAGKVKYGECQPLGPWICGAMLLCL
ncbi:MAG: prepilin peptidase [Firmicutes bacterium]|nr:prepilin peptidase [Bacillota bacterium]